MRSRLRRVSLKDVRGRMGSGGDVFAPYPTREGSFGVLTDERGRKIFHSEEDFSSGTDSEGGDRDDRPMPFVGESEMGECGVP